MNLAFERISVQGRSGNLLLHLCGFSPFYLYFFTVLPLLCFYSQVLKAKVFLTSFGSS